MHYKFFLDSECHDALYKCPTVKQGRRSEGRVTGSKGKAMALQTDDEGCKPKTGWIRGPPPEKNFAATPLRFA